MNLNLAPARENHRRKGLASSGILLTYRWLLALLVLLCACGPVRLVSAYDRIIDQGTSEVDSKVVAFTTKMVRLSGTPEGTYTSNAGFYDEMKGAMATLKMRAMADDKNEITVKMFQELDDNLERLRQLHEMGKERGLTKVIADPALQAIETTCRAITKFELAKQRGETATKN